MTRAKLLDALQGDRRLQEDLLRFCRYMEALVAYKVPRPEGQLTMTDNQRATQFAKLEITGTFEVLTGLHIGTGGGFSAIGATDKPVVRDPHETATDSRHQPEGQSAHPAFAAVRRR